MAYMLYIYPWTNISDNVMPYCKTYTETVVAVTVPIVVVEVEYSCIRTIVVVTTTFEERVVWIDKIGIIVLQVYPHAFRSSFARTKSSHYLFLLFTSNVAIISCFAQITDITLLYCKTYTETVEAATVPIVAVEVEYSCINPIVIVTSTFEERTHRIHEVSIITTGLSPFILTFR